MQLDELLERQHRSWADNEPISIENLLSDSVGLTQGSDAIVDLIYAEVLIREQRGEHPSKEDYVSRFPKLSDAIERQFQVHGALELASEAEVLTDAGGDNSTLGRTDGSRVAFAFAPPTIPGFELNELLGRGGSGVAWRARDTRLDRTVAIKFLLNNEKDAKAEANSERLSREAAAAANLLHPSIVQVHQIGEAGGVPFLVMEYVEGGSLAEELRAGPMPAEKSVELVTSIADAVQHSHEKGIIHRDIKPGNILLSLTGVPQVCDFGLARKLDADYSLHQTGDVVGTPAYMPPEQARGEVADERSDVYSIGAVLYELLCGRSPFQAAHPWEILYQVTTIDPLPLRQLNSAIPIDLETICQKCLEKNSDRRYQTAADLAADLKRYTEGKPIHARPVSALGKFSKWCLRNKVVAGLSAASLLLLSTLAIGSTVAAVQLSESNRKILQEQQLASEAQEKAISDRTVAIDTLYELIDQFYDQQVSESLSLDARENLAVAAIEGLRRISAIEGDAASMRTAILAKQRIGEIQAQRGHSELAMTEFEEALKMARDHQAAAPDDFDRKTKLASMINYLVHHCNRVGEVERARQLVMESSQILDEQILEQPNNKEVLRRWVTTRSGEIDVLWVSQPPEASIELGLQSLDNVQTLYDTTRDDEQSDGLRVVNQFYIRLGRAFHEAGKLPDAEKYYKLASEVIAEAMEKFPEKTNLFSTSAVTNKLYGMLLNYQNQFYEAREVFETAVKDTEFVVSLDPKNLTNRKEVANVRVFRSKTLTIIGELDSAIEDLEFAASIYEEILELAPGDVSSRLTMMEIYVDLIDAFNRVHRFDEGKDAARKVVEIVDREDIQDSESSKLFRWYAELNIRALDMVEGKPIEEPTAEDRAFALFYVAFVFSDRDSDDSLDEESMELVRLLEPDSTFTTVTELFQYMGSLRLTHPVLKGTLPLFEARTYARQAALLDAADQKSESDMLRIEKLKKQAVDLLVGFSKALPGEVNRIYQEPDLIWLRGTELFAESGLSLEGAD